MPADRLLHPRCCKSAKVSKLTDLEFRVWTQYLLSADDFGVMHATAVQMQADNLHLATRPAKLLQRCLDVLVTCGLLLRFTHQDQPYVFSHNWQSYQKVEYPRSTDNPKPEAIDVCDEPTRALLEKHPGGQRKDRKRAEGVPNDSERASGIDSEDVSSTRAGAPAKRLTANGIRLTANGSEGVQGEIPSMDIWARELVDLYPAQGRCGWNLVERPLFAVLTADLGTPADTAWVLLLARLELQKRSHQWRVKGMIPRLDKWLREGLHLQELPELAPAAERLSKTTATTASAVAEIMGVKP